MEVLTSTYSRICIHIVLGGSASGRAIPRLLHGRTLPRFTVTGVHLQPVYLSSGDEVCPRCGEACLHGGGAGGLIM